MNDWYTVDDTNAHILVADGVYSFQHHGNDWYATWRSIPIDRSGNYSVSLRASRTRGSVDNGYGLYLGGKDVNNFYALMLSNEGYVSFSEIKDGTWNKIEDWRRVSMNTANNSWNSLELKKNGSFWDIYVGGSIACEIPASHLPGENFGFIVENDQDVDFDDFT
jgi:hypothetical protein